MPTHRQDGREDSGPLFPTVVVSGPLQKFWIPDFFQESGRDVPDGREREGEGGGRGREGREERGRRESVRNVYVTNGFSPISGKNGIPVKMA